MLLGAIALLATLFVPTASAETPTNATATLGASQTGDPDGTGTVMVQLNGTTGEVCFMMAVANISAPTVAHIHAGTAGTTGGVVVDFDVPTNGLAGCVMAAAADVAAIIAAPGDYYVNIHNMDYPAGALRAQIDALTDGPAVSSTVLAPNAVGAAGDPDGSGTVDLEFDDATGEICYDLTTMNLDPIVAGHIHIGNAASSGGVLVDLMITGDGTGCVTTTVPNVQNILANPAGHYVNIHTSVFGAGAVRGQVTATTVVQESTFAVDGLGFGDPDGSGTAVLTMYEGGDVCFDLQYMNITAPAAAAHVHAGADGVMGGVVIDLDIATNGMMGCVMSTDAQIAAIEAMPSDFYVNVHTSDFPAGAIRGQLATAPAPPTTELRLPLMPTGDPDANGIGGLNIDPLTGRICYDLLIVDIDPVTAAHIHVGAAGTNGGVVVNLDTPANGSSGCVYVTPAIAAAVVADLPGHYLNVHTAAAPAGAVRSQLDEVLTCDGQPVTIDLNVDSTLQGTPGNDVILGTPGGDNITADAGDDIVCGWHGDDVIVGGDGDDLLIGDDGNDTLYGDAGNDRALGNDGTDQLFGGPDDDVLRGGPDADVVSGEDGDDRVLGGTGDDTLRGGLGTDYLGGFGGNDTITGGDGADLIFGGFGADTIEGNGGDDVIRGLVGNDAIDGGTGDDMLFGDRGNDTINGEAGNDTIRGGNADDILYGNAGDDDIAGGRADDAMFGGAGTDSCAGNLDFAGDTADSTCETIIGVP